MGEAERACDELCMAPSVWQVWLVFSLQPERWLPHNKSSVWLSVKCWHPSVVRHFVFSSVAEGKAGGKTRGLALPWKHWGPNTVDEVVIGRIVDPSLPFPSVCFMFSANRLDLPIHMEKSTKENILTGKAKKKKKKFSFEKCHFSLLLPPWGYLLFFNKTVAKAGRVWKWNSCVCREKFSVLIYYSLVAVTFILLWRTLKHCTLCLFVHKAGRRISCVLRSWLKMLCIWGWPDGWADFQTEIWATLL